MKNQKQVNRKHYGSLKYAHEARWVSYYYQLESVFFTKPKTLMEIGVGDGVVGNYIKNNTEIKYTSLDIASDLEPDIVGDLLNTPFPDDTFDTVCAFEVLEHLPFDDFEKSLKELKRVSKRYVIISLPHFGPPLKLSFKIPFIKEIKLAWKIPYRQEHVFNGEHFWEIGKKHFPPTLVRGILKKYFNIKKEFIPHDSQYHHFFILETK